MKPTVFIVDQPRYNLAEIRLRARELCERAGLQVRGASVFVKPSFVYPARPPRNLGINTQPEVVAGVARALRDLGASRVMVGEDCLAGPSQSGFLAMGVLPLLRGVAEPVYLQDEERVEVRVPDPLVEGSFRLPKKLMDADLFVSLPKLKVNMYATVTLSVKNHIGLLLAADRLTHHHYDIHKKIADLYRSRLPDFVITDAIMAGEGQGPMHAEPANLGVLIAGANGVAVDAVACRMMGYEPEEIEHLTHLAAAGAGPLGLDEIELEGAELLAQRKRVLSRPRVDFGDYDPRLAFFVGRELACPQGCVGMIRGTLDSFLPPADWKPVSGYNFIVGKPVSDLPANLDRGKTFVIGDCAAEHRSRGTFIPGCPIPPMAITYALLKRGVFTPVTSRYRDLGWGHLAHALGIKVR